MNTFSNRLIRPGVAVLLGLAALGAAHADGGRRMPRDVPKAYIAECAACHIAYAPGLLPARSWQRIMSGLDHHYGTDASLDEATVRQLSTWLVANARTYKRVNEEPPQDRLTRSAWFERKHDDIPPSVWEHAAIRSAANCGACHTGADRGDFDDDHIRLPAGVSLGLRRFWHD
ncbi:diheme cytochrome c [Hydrogenophaga pseudoflava]|uniref:diheme cytochrome c n=1 Tax=Hydrogenophaga pseudoflava TaxID=47421 RepID=UPI0027E546A3|nr:diheme cytochrome c [Hydrogenophaga pseudoflava]MDQ7747072.1 diheme cytochrome c [Hydrogenophaga pseudoflava]